MTNGCVDNGDNSRILAWCDIGATPRVQWRLSNTERKRLHSIAHTCEPGAWWFWPADAINSYPTRAACFTDLRDHAVRLMKGRG